MLFDRIQALSFLMKVLCRRHPNGHKYTDPIDGSSFRKFLPYGYNNVRKNALSPSTFSLERHRLLWLYLENETPFFKNKLNDSRLIALRVSYKYT